jgi:hypothetical protein
MELAILILLICIVLWLVFYEVYITKKLNRMRDNIDAIISNGMTAHEKHLKYFMSDIKELVNKLSNEYTDCINQIGNQHCNFTKTAIEKSENYYYKALKIVLESLKVFSEDLVEFEEHIDKSIKEINCTKKKNNNKEIKVE